MSDAEQTPPVTEPVPAQEPAQTTEEAPAEPLVDMTNDPLTLYSRSLYTYTLTLWTESRRVAEEKARLRAQAIAAHAAAQRKAQQTPSAQSTSTAPPSALEKQT